MPAAGSWRQTDKLAESKTFIFGDCSMKLYWKQFGDTANCYLGDRKVGKVYLNTFYPENFSNRYQVNCYLPGATRKLAKFATKEKAMLALEKIVNNWLTQIAKIQETTNENQT